MSSKGEKNVPLHDIWRQSCRYGTGVHLHPTFLSVSLIYHPLLLKMKAFVGRVLPHYSKWSKIKRARSIIFHTRKFYVTFFFIWKYITKFLKLTTRRRHQPLGICADRTAGASHNAFIIELSLLCVAFVRTLCHLRMNYRDWPNIWQSRGVPWCPVTSSKLSSLSWSGCCQGVDTFLQDRGR